MQAVWAKVFRDAVFPAASLNTFFGQLHAGCSAQSVQGRCLPNTVPEHLHCPNSKSVQGRRRIFSTLNSAWVAGNYLEPSFSRALHCRELLGTTSIWWFGTKLPFGDRCPQTPYPLRDYLVPLFKVFRVVVFRWLILNTRSVERIPKNIKNLLRKLSFLGSRWRSFAGNLSIESDEK